MAFKHKKQHIIEDNGFKWDWQQRCLLHDWHLILYVKEYIHRVR